MKVDINDLNPGDILYENKFLKIQMINPNYPFLIMKAPGSVIVPYDKDMNVYLLERERINLGHVYELPRGFVDLNELGKMGALRELYEESGMKPVQGANAKLLGLLQPDTGVMNNSVTCYCVEVARQEDYYHKDSDEVNQVHKVIRLSTENITKLLMSHKIADSYTH